MARWWIFLLLLAGMEKTSGEIAREAPSAPVPPLPSVEPPLPSAPLKTSFSSPLPRFASLRAKAVNMHVGPGNNYPTQWVFVRPGLPVEIIAEFDTWRQIRDWQGTQGWVHKSLLCGKRTAIVQQKQRKLYKEPKETSRVLAYLEPGVLGKLMECRNDWCRLDVQGHRGWVKRRCVWGVYPHEEKFK